MEQHQYYPEEVLIEKMERGEYGWLDYVNHFSAEWQENDLAVSDETAAEFVHHKDEQLEAAMEVGDA